MFAGAITPRTRVVMFSHITSGTGIGMPAKELCALARSRGALAVVDGAQAVGQIRVDVKELGCDVYAASPHNGCSRPRVPAFSTSSATCSRASGTRWPAPASMMPRAGRFDSCTTARGAPPRCGGYRPH